MSAPAMSVETARNEYLNLKSQIGSIAQKLNELDQERNEYDLVVQALEPMDENRKCYRLVGGVLVERTVAEVRPAISSNLTGIESIIESLVKQLKKFEEEAENLRSEYGLAFSTEEGGEAGSSDKKSSGLLV